MVSSLGTGRCGLLLWPTTAVYYDEGVLDVLSSFACICNSVIPFSLVQDVAAYSVLITVRYSFFVQDAAAYSVVITVRCPFFAQDAASYSLLITVRYPFFFQDRSLLTVDNRAMSFLFSGRRGLLRRGCL